MEYIRIVDRRPGPIQARFWLEWAEKPSPAMNTPVAHALLPVMVFLMTNTHVERRLPSPAMNTSVAHALLPVMVFLMTNKHVERRRPRLR